MIRRQEDVMRQTHVLTALAIFAVSGAVNHFQSHAEAWQGDVIKNLNGILVERESLIYKVGTDAYSGMSSSDMRPGGISSEQGSVAGSQSRYTGEYKAGSPGNEGRYGSNPSENYFKKESSGSSTGPYGGSVYGGPPTTPSADPMIRELSREPSMR
jgi:hypothetical protein